MWWASPNQLMVCIEQKKSGGRENFLSVPILKLWHSLILLLECDLQYPLFSGFILRLYYSINSQPFQRVESMTSQSPLLYGPILKRNSFIWISIYLSISSCWFFSSGEPWPTEPLLFVCWLKRRYDLTASLNRTISSLLSPHSSILLLPWREGAERNCSRGIILSSLSWEVKFLRVRVIVV